MESYNQAKADSFNEYLLQILNNASLSLMISIGHRSKLFDVMGYLNKHATSHEIAEAASLNERYVRECLGALVTGRIVDYDKNNQTYYLPAEHASVLTRKAYPNNFAINMQYIPVLAEVEDKILECFKKGGGIGYDAFPSFHRVMAEESDQTIMAHLIDNILPLENGLLAALKSGIKVADIGCGQGHALLLMAEHFPNSEFVGFDLCADPLIAGEKITKDKQLTNITFIEKDLTALDVTDADKFELITAFDAIHDQAKPDVVLKNIYNALKDNGLFLMQDIKTHTALNENMNNPLTPFLYVISCLHCMTVSLAQNGMGLGTCWGKEKALEMLAVAGFNSINVYELEHDIQNYYYIAKK